MRILHVHSGNLYGGVETLMVTLARLGSLAPETEHRFALCFSGRLKDELRAAGAEVADLGAVRFRRPISLWRARRRLAAHLGSDRPELAITHSSWSHAAFAGVVAAAGLPLLFWLHGAVTGRPWLERLAARRPPDFVLSNSRFTGASLPALFPGAPSEVMYLPVDPPPAGLAGQRAALRAEIGTPEAAAVVIQVSRMEAWKGHSGHLKALAKLGGEPPWECWLVGGAQRPEERRYRESLRRLACELGIAGQVRLLGERADVPALLAAADVFCQPNAGPEPFGLALVEALYAGLPVITTRMGGAAEIVVDRRCGLVVPPGDDNALAAALATLVADPARRRALGAAGPTRARELCDPERRMRRLAEVCARVAAEGER